VQGEASLLCSAVGQVLVSLRQAMHFGVWNVFDLQALFKLDTVGIVNANLEFGIRVLV